MTTKPEYYTPEQLAREFVIPKWIVHHNIENGKLKVMYRTFDDNGRAILDDKPPTDSRYPPSMSRVVMAEEAERFAEQYGADHNVPPASGPIQTNGDKNPQHPGGGAPEATITAAVKWAFSRLKDTGNTEIIKRGNVKGFLKYLKECITEGNSNYSEYLVERIKDVKNIDGDCTITIHSLTPKEKSQSVPTGKDIKIKKARISSILSELRKKE